MSDNISVSTDWVNLGNSKLILSFSLFSTDGAYEVQAKMKDDTEFGDTIPGFQNIGMQESLSCVAVRVRTVSGTINLSYFIKTQ